MKVEIEELAPCKKSVLVEVPQERVDAAFKEIYNQLKREVRIPGFRPGKAPLSIVKARFGEYAKAQVMEALFRESYEKLLEEHELRPAADPSFEDVEFDEGKPFKYRVVMEVHPEFELKDYTNIEIEKEKFVITDEDVDRFIDELRQNMATLEDKDGPAEMGDVVIMDYEVYEGDQPIEDSKIEGATINLGAGETVKGFDEQVVGHKAGDRFDVEVEFPEDHFDKRVAGKKVVFKCVLKSVKKKVVPELDEEFAKKFGVETVEALKEKARAQLEEELAKTAHNNALARLAEKLAEQYDFPLPPSLVEQELEKRMKDYELDLRLQGVQPKEEDLEKKKEELKKAVEKDLRLAYVLREIAKKEGVEVTRGDVEAHLERLSKSSNIPMEQIVSIMQKTGRLNSLIEDMLIKKTLEHLLTKVKVVEKETPLKKEEGDK